MHFILYSLQPIMTLEKGKVKLLIFFISMILLKKEICSKEPVCESFFTIHEMHEIKWNSLTGS